MASTHEDCRICKHSAKITTTGLQQLFQVQKGNSLTDIPLYMDYARTPSEQCWSLSLYHAKEALYVRESKCGACWAVMKKGRYLNGYRVTGGVKMKCTESINTQVYSMKEICTAAQGGRHWIPARWKPNEMYIIHIIMGRLNLKIKSHAAYMPVSRALRLHMTSMWLKKTFVS
ncbi:hypothetical protein M440DRAFT_339445 [Trichoderma longibrachiatum ATCC 18648]|uniref:Uncharacterized protein n=1 Tax=Trichoderma longibrachiatum ATCC 18648 TaxID=983965 RepID=A0A2T4C0Y1_TRILO|nr:hypothetical protein M440DRAFT_339445 [Trichoderma longibrachiatum ATCC 18648]